MRDPRLRPVAVCWFFIVSSHGGEWKRLSGVSFIRVLIPCLRALPLGSHYFSTFPKAPSLSSIILGCGVTWIWEWQTFSKEHCIISDIVWYWTFPKSLLVKGLVPRVAFLAGNGTFGMWGIVGSLGYWWHNLEGDCGTRLLPFFSLLSCSWCKHFCSSTCSCHDVLPLRSPQNNGIINHGLEPPQL